MGDQDAVNDYFSKFDKAEENEINTPDSSSETKVSSEESKEDTKTEKLIKDDSDKSEDTDSKKDNKVEDNTPFHKHPRWKEKLANEKRLKENNKSLQKKYDEAMKEIESSKFKPLTDEQLNSMKPSEIMEYTKKQMEREYNQKQDLSKKEEEEADKYVDETLGRLKDEGNDFDENKLLAYAEKFTQGDIDKAFELYQMLDKTKEKGAKEEAVMTEKKKQAESNSSNRGQTSKTSGFRRGTSWDNLDLK